jgi:hypothetical protein
MGTPVINPAKNTWANLHQNGWEASTTVLAIKALT